MKPTLYRMFLLEETCPLGVDAKALLEERGFTIEEDILRSPEKVKAFEEAHGVPTTPTIFIRGDRIGGSDELESHIEA